MWSQGSLAATKVMLRNLSRSSSVFVPIDGKIYLDNGYSYGEVERVSLNSNHSEVIMNINGSCYALFVDQNKTLYCSLPHFHRVVKLFLNGKTKIPSTCAGTGLAGSSPSKLNSPRGISVDWDLNLYVADCGNNRIQFFPSGQLTGRTLIGTGAANTMASNCPTGIILDAENYLFVVDSNNHRIIRSGVNGYSCIVGCAGSNVSSAMKLSFPQRLAFDSYGNLVVTDNNQSRIQIFTVKNNSCGK